MRSKLPRVLILLAFVAIVVVLSFFIKKITSKDAGLLVETTPTSTLFLNGESLGKTPLDISINPGEVQLKLVPDSFESPLAAYETKLTLTPGVKSVVFRDFATDNELSSGAVVSFEKSPGDAGSLAVVSYPETAQVFVEGISKGFTPLKVEDLKGELRLKTSIPGYHDKEIRITPKEGYLLTASIDMAKDPSYEAMLPTQAEEEVVKEQKSTEKKETIVKILPTPVGFLRVRKEPINGEEVAQVETGKEYLYLEVDSETGWYRIIYENDKSGWISDDYAEKVEDGELSET